MTSEVKARRPYASPRRREQAGATRAAILQAARVLFGSAGYAGTSIAEIARTARVSPQTVAAVFGTKRAIMFGLLEVVDAEGHVAENAGRVATARSAEEVIAAGVRLTRQMNEHAGDLLAMARSAAASEPDVAEAVAEGNRRHVAGALSVARRLDQLGVLGTRTVLEAGAIVGTLTTPDVYATLTGTYGWSFDVAEAWLIEILCRDLVDPPGSAA